jgi:hypothetical protein
MAEQSAQDALYQHYGDMELRIVDEPTGGGAGMSGEEAGAFLRGLRPGVRVRQSLAAAAKIFTGKA